MIKENIRIYGERFDYPHERKAFKRFLWMIYDCFEKNEKLYYIIVEPSINGKRPDLLLMSDNAIIIVDLKELDLAEKEESNLIHLSGTAKSTWKYHLPNGREIAIGNPFSKKNPYIQVHSYRSELAKWISEHSEEIFSTKLNQNQAITFLHSWVVVSPGYDGKWQSDIDLSGEKLAFSRSRNKLWFNIFSIDQLAGEFDCAPLLHKPANLNQKFTYNEIQKIVDLLEVQQQTNHRDILQEYPWTSSLFSKPQELDKLVDRKIQIQPLQKVLYDQKISTIIVQGMVGSGKTALAAHFVHEAKLKHCRVRWLDCRHNPDISLDSILSALSYEVSGLSRSAIRNPENSYHQRIHLACEFLDQRPTIIVFDDYHLLSNQTTINNNLINIATRYPNIKFLLTSSKRTTNVAGSTDTLLKLDLDEIPLSDFAEFVQMYTPNLYLSPQEFEIVWKKMSGNPKLFQLSIPLIRQYAWMGNLSELPLPESRDYFQSILATISEDARELATRLSVFRGKFNFQLIQLISETDKHDTVKLVEELVDKYILEELSNQRTFVLVELVRRYLYNELAEKEKDKLAAHRNAGEYLTKLAMLTTDKTVKVDYLVEAVFHYDIGGPHKQLLNISNELYELLITSGDYERASFVAYSAISSAQKLQNNNLTATWMLKAARVEIRQERQAELEKLLLEATSLLPDPRKKLSEPQQLFWKDIEAQIYFIKGRFNYNAHEYDQSLRYLNKGIEITKETHNDLLKARFLAWIARIERQKTLYDQSLDHIKEFLEIAQQYGEQALIWDAKIHLGLIRRSQGSLSEAEGYFKETFDAAKNVGNPKDIVYALGNLGRTQMLLNKYIEAQKSMEKSLSISRELHMSRGIRIQLTNLAELNIRLGRISTAEKYLDESEILNKEANDPVGIAWNHKHRGQILKKKGEIDDGIELIKQGKAILIEIGNKEYLADFDSSLEQEEQLLLEMQNL